jgi:hypothetical protein
MKKTLYYRLWLACSGYCLIFLLTACGGSTYTIGQTATPTHRIPSVGATPGTGGIGTIPSTQPSSQPGTTSPVVQSTSVDCPAVGTARAAVTTPLTLGNHQVLSYVYNQNTGEQGDYTAIRLYDITDGSKTDIIKLYNATTLLYAQISKDGQWILFAAQIANETKIQLVRVDGQDLQTLYCSTASQSVSDLLWSPDQKSVIFSLMTSTNSGPSFSGIYLLDIMNGMILQELGAQASLSPMFAMWLDNTKVYLTDEDGASPGTENIYLLDTGKDAPQKLTDLQRIATVTVPPCGDFEKSLDGTQLLLSHCSLNQKGHPTTPSTITIQPATGDPVHVIYKSRDLAIFEMRVISSTTLLLLVQNDTDTTLNGLWKMNIDGTNLTRLASDNKLIGDDWFAHVMTPWSNVSRDGSLYSFQQEQGPVEVLVFGSLAGGILQPVEDAGNQDVIGWTTM